MSEGCGVDSGHLPAGRPAKPQQPQPASRADSGDWSSRAARSTSISRAVCSARSRIAAHPVQAVRHAGKHGRSPSGAHARSTQVSLLPPPCDEFTTSDPSPQRHSRQASRHQRDVLAIQNVRTQIHMPRLHFSIEKARRARKTQASAARCSSAALPRFAGGILPSAPQCCADRSAFHSRPTRPRPSRRVRPDVPARMLRCDRSVSR